MHTYMEAVKEACRSPRSSIGAFVCFRCAVGICTVPKLFPLRMRREHCVKEWRPNLDTITLVFQGFNRNTALFEQYRYPLTHSDALLPVHGLTIFNARRCLVEKWNLLCESICNLREHIREKRERTGVSLENLKELSVLLAQSLLKDKCCRIVF